MSRKSFTLLDTALVGPAIADAFRKLDPRTQWRSPVMFVVYVGSIITTLLFIQSLLGQGEASPGFILAIAVWLWFTVLFANFAESLAEGRSKAQAASLRALKQAVMAKKLKEPKHGSGWLPCYASDLRKGNVVQVEAGDVIPADGEVIEGVASVDESAITGESAPVIRESGGDFSAVTGGTRVLSDWLVVRITVNPGEAFIDRMIAMVEGAKRQKTPNEIALTILLVALTIIFLIVTVTLLPLSLFSVEAAKAGAPITITVLFGASAGVGKTYAMLSAGRKLQAEGRDVLVGVVETHGRSETAALLEGVPLLPLKAIDYRGRTITEFDIDAALARRPALILVDELAHSNAAGSRHPKRWQDVDELLDAGIDVFTTVNVQHLESLNDVVGGITGIRVSETLPDTVFDDADEVVLVDIPADELLARLKVGKVYQAEQAERASRNFFRKGNLIALRELTLRRMADRIGDDVQAYRVEKSIGAVWKTGSTLLACVGPRPGGKHVIRSTAQLAAQLNAGWHAVYIETPRLQRLPAAQREQILRTLKLAQDLGATTAVLAGSDIARTIADYAVANNFSKIVLGRAHPALPWLSPHHKRLSVLAPALDLIQIGGAAPAGASASAGSAAFAASLQRNLKEPRYLWATAASLATALVATPLLPYLDLANIVMLFLLTVVLVAVRLGRGPAVLATFVSVAAFDFFFVPPRFSFAVSDLQYTVTFIVMLAVGLITAHLTADLRYQARVASYRESRSRALYQFARELSGTLQTEQIFDTTCDFIGRTFHAKATLLLPDADGRLQPAEDDGPTLAGTALDIGIAQWAFDHAEPAGIGTDTLPGSSLFYLPVVAPMRTRGVLAIEPESPRWILIPEQRQQLDTFATLAAIALERVHYIEVAQDALVHMESERLRNSLLATLSHDLRTPLTVPVGLSESLMMARPPLPAAQHGLAEALHDESLRMSSLVANLLDMARMESGNVRLDLQWQPFEEVVGSALRASHAILAGHDVQVHLAPDLPLVRFDAVLIERVLCNLIENAGKYTPADSRIEIAARVSGDMLEVAVHDNGPGLPAGREEAIFNKFVRGDPESATPGVGLGLAICRAIVEAHKGAMHAARSPEGGASFVFTLPAGRAPSVPDELVDTAAPD